MAEKSIPQHRTCEICGEESPSVPLTPWADAPGNRWVHAGSCFLEFGIIQNTHAGSALREAIQRLGSLLRSRGDAWRKIAEESQGEVMRLRGEVDRMGVVCGEAEAALLMAACGCSAAGGFKCSRCKALAALRPAEALHEAGRKA